MSPCLKALKSWRVPVNCCSLTSMTVAHFLHQTDTGLALRKHKVIYSASPTLFSPSCSLPLSLSLPLMYLHYCYANRSLVSNASVVPASLVPLFPLKPHSISKFLLLVPSLDMTPPLLHLAAAFHLSHLHRPPSLCVCVFLCSIVLL